MMDNTGETPETMPTGTDRPQKADADGDDTAPKKAPMVGTTDADTPHPTLVWKTDGLQAIAVEARINQFYVHARLDTCGRMNYMSAELFGALRDAEDERWAHEGVKIGPKAPPSTVLVTQATLTAMDLDDAIEFTVLPGAEHPLVLGAEIALRWLLGGKQGALAEHVPATIWPPAHVTVDTKTWMLALQDDEFRNKMRTTKVDARGAMDALGDAARKKHWESLPPPIGRLFEEWIDVGMRLEAAMDAFAPAKLIYESRRNADPLCFAEPWTYRPDSDILPEDRPVVGPSDDEEDEMDAGWTDETGDDMEELVWPPFEV